MGDRSEQRNAAMRATLDPIAPGERPWPVTVSAVIAGLTGLGNLIAYIAGAKVEGKHPAAGGIIVFSLLMITCAVGMWRLRYWAVLGFMGLLAIIVTLFALLHDRGQQSAGPDRAGGDHRRLRLSLPQARARPQPHPDAEIPRSVVP